MIYKSGVKNAQEILMKEFSTVDLHSGDTPLVAAAIHNGSLLSDHIKKINALSEAERLREEDPFTGSWTSITDKKIIAHYSRFEVDLNRPRDKAVYHEPGDSWGLNTWRIKPSPEVLAQLLEKYDAFYDELHRGFSHLINRCGHVVVYDLHNYNHRRQGADSPADNPQLNPEVNVGTGTMDRVFWGAIVDRFITDLRAFDFLGRNLDVRENIKFKGGYFSRWLHENFPGSVCCLAIEFKKFFMDEWSGEADQVQLDTILAALLSTVPGILAELKKFDSL